MADEKKFLSQDDLVYFNKTVNERLISRLKYKGDLEIDPVWTDWSVVAPAEIGHVYYLTGVSTVTINDITYSAGEWVIVMNKVIKKDDGSLVDEDGNTTAVRVRKLGSSGLPLGELGDGLAFVDGEWKLQPHYGYVEEGTPTQLNYQLPIMSDGRGDLWDFPPMVLGKEYSITIDVLYQKSGVATINDEGNVALILDGIWRDLYTDSATGVTYLRAVEAESYPGLPLVSIITPGQEVWHKFDKRYIDPACIQLVTELPEIAAADDLSLYLLFNCPINPENTVRYTLADTFAAAGNIANENGIFDAEGNLLYDWTQTAVVRDDLIGDVLKQDDAGSIWYYIYDGDAAMRYSTDAPSPANLPMMYSLYTVDQSNPTAVEWLRIWPSKEEACVGIEPAFIHQLEAW